MMFGSEDDLSVYGFLRTNFMMVTNMKDYVTLDPDDIDADFWCNCRENKIAHFKQDLYNKHFSRQGQGKKDENDSLWKRNKLWPNNFDMGGPIPDNVHDWFYNDGKGLFCSQCRHLSWD